MNTDLKLFQLSLTRCDLVFINPVKSVGVLLETVLTYDFWEFCFGFGSLDARALLGRCLTVLLPRVVASFLS